MHRAGTLSSTTLLIDLQLSELTRSARNFVESYVCCSSYALVRLATSLGFFAFRIQTRESCLYPAYARIARLSTGLCSRLTKLLICARIRRFYPIIFTLMAYTKRSSGPSSYKSKPSFGGKPPWKGGSKGGFSPRGEMHSAQCNECGRSCEVPFKPNGRKPVLCNACFKLGGDTKPKSFGKNRHGDAPHRAGSYRERSVTSSDDYNEQLKIINAKLDAIIEALEEGM